MAAKISPLGWQIAELKPYRYFAVGCIVFYTGTLLQLLHGQS
jgi:hypothetical protein